MTLVVGVDLGGTKTAAAVVDPAGASGPVLTAPTPAAAGPEAVLDVVARLVLDALGAAGLSPDQLAAVGVGTAGVVDAGRGVIVSATDSLPGWAGTDVAAGLRRRLGARGVAPLVVVENDVDAHAAGEAWLGAAAGMPAALMVAVGTGVGGAVVLDGRLLRGAHHLAGEIGHVPVPGAEGLRCGCGRDGHVEAIGCGPALHRLFLVRGGDAASPDARDVVARARRGDLVALGAVRDSATAVGRAVAGVVTVLDPDVVVVGGGLAEAGPVWWEPMEAALRSEVVEPLAEIPVVPARLGQGAAIVGAAHRAHLSLASTPAAPAHAAAAAHRGPAATAAAGTSTGDRP